MKKIYILIIFLIASYSFSQYSRIFDNYWYLTNVIENGVNNIPPTSTMGISFDSNMLNAQACLNLFASVNFENNNTNFSATNFQYCLCMCFNPSAENYENNIYFPFLNNDINNLSNINYFTYSISENQGVKALIINSEFNKQAVYSSVMLSSQKFEKLNFSIFPNPSDEFIEILISSDLVNSATVEIFNEIGILCKFQKNISNKTKIEIKDLSTGVYFVKIKNENYFSVKKLIVK